MPHVYRAVRELAGHPLVGTGDCVELVKQLAPGLKGVPTISWRQGEQVIEVANKLEAGTAIATFEKGRYPHGISGQHAAFFVSSAGSAVSGLWTNGKTTRTSRWWGCDMSPAKEKPRMGSGRTPAIMPKHSR
jgi:hypothetical protein